MSSSNDNPFRRKPKAPSPEGQSDATAAPRPAHAKISGKSREEPRGGGRRFDRNDRNDRNDRRDRGPTRGPARGPRGQKGPPPPSGRFGVTKGTQGGGLRRLPGPMQDLADGRVERLRRPPPKGAPIDDERIGFLFPGVRNLDARAVYDGRVSQLRAATSKSDDAALADGFFDVHVLALYRARNVTDFDAFAESVVGVSGERARALAQQGAERAGATLDPAPMHVVALWLRIEASLLRDCPGGRVTVRGRGDALRVILDMPASDVNRVAIALFDLGGAANGLRPFLRGEEPEPRRAESRPEPQQRGDGRRPFRPSGPRRR